MNWKLGKKRIIITISLICMGLLSLTINIVIISIPPYSPIKHTVDSKTGIVTFELDKEYSFDGIQLSLSNFPQPDFDSETSEISFRAFDLAIGEHDFVYFIAHKRDNAEEQIGIEFEILHQSDSKILIQEFPNGVQFPGDRQMYTYNY